MPNHWYHDKFTEGIMGRDVARKYHWVHQELDSTAAMSGPGHRRDAEHSIAHILKVSHGDMTAVAVAQIHILLDGMGITYMQSESVKTMVDLMTLAMGGGHQPYHKKPNMNANVRSMARNVFSMQDLLRRALRPRY